MSSNVRLSVRILSAILAVGGLVMVVMGAIAWNMTKTELSSQKIDVSSNSYALDGKKAPSNLKANDANGPFDALSEVKLIQMHTRENLKAAGYPNGTVYADIPMPDSKELATCEKDASSSANCATDIKNDSERSFLDNSNFKQASLYTSVMAFGVSALVIGVGVVLFIIAAVGILVAARKKDAEALEASAGRKSTVSTK